MAGRPPFNSVAHDLKRLFAVVCFLVCLLVAGLFVLVLHNGIGRYIYGTESETIRIAQITAVESCFYHRKIRYRLWLTRWLFETENFRSSEPSDRMYYCGTISGDGANATYILPNSGWTFGLTAPREELFARLEVGCSYRIRYVKVRVSGSGWLAREITRISKELGCEQPGPPASSG